jgi:YggT family protein
MTSVFGLLASLLNIFGLILIARLILDYVQMFSRTWRPTGIVLVFVELVFSLTDPPLKFVRRFVPMVRIGSISLDISFIVLILGIRVLERILLSI